MRQGTDVSIPCKMSAEKALRKQLTNPLRLEAAGLDIDSVAEPLVLPLYLQAFSFREVSGRIRIHDQRATKIPQLVLLDTDVAAVLRWLKTLFQRAI